MYRKIYSHANSIRVMMMMMMVIAYSRVWINRVKLSILFVVS